MNPLLRLSILVLVCCAGQVLAQSTSTSSGHAYPTKPIRLIVPSPACESIDGIARVI